MMDLAIFDTVLLDCDGVIWTGMHLIDGAKESITKLKASGKQLLFVTNNASKSRKEYLEKFTLLGIPCTIDDIFSSAYASAYYLMKNDFKKHVYVIGMNGITSELEQLGIRWKGSHLDNQNFVDMTDIHVDPDPDIGCVMLGFDLNFNYRKMAKAYTYLANKECLFIATNSDLTYPSKACTYPGTGSFLASLTASTERQPIVIGKPHQTMMDMIVSRFKLDRSRTLMVGDRLDTDILFGQTAGMKSLLVMTGVTQPQDLDGSITPDYILDSLGHLGI